VRNPRYIIVVMLPFLGAALLPWLAPDAVARVAALTVFWAGVLNVFMAGFIVGDVALQQVQNANNDGRLRLRAVSAVALVVSTLVATALYFLWSPMVSISLMALMLYFNCRILRATAYGSSVTALEFGFFQKNVWVALGCMLMLLLSYFRYFNLH
jgi:signal transduction histidine kinase